MSQLCSSNVLEYGKLLNYHGCFCKLYIQYQNGQGIERRWHYFKLKGCFKANVETWYFPTKNHRNGGIWQSRGSKFLHKQSSFKGCLQSMVIFHQRSISTKGHLPSKISFHQKSSSINGRLPSNVVFHQMLSSIKCRLPSLIFHQRSSSWDRR